MCNVISIQMPQKRNELKSTDVQLLTLFHLSFSVVLFNFTWVTRYVLSVESSSLVLNDTFHVDMFFVLFFFCRGVQ